MRDKPSISTIIEKKSLTSVNLGGTKQNIDKQHTFNLLPNHILTQLHDSKISIHQIPKKMTN